MFLEEIDHDLIDEELILESSVFASSEEIVYVSEDEPFLTKKKPGSFFSSVDDL